MDINKYITYLVHAVTIGVFIWAGTNISSMSNEMATLSTSLKFHAQAMQETQNAQKIIINNITDIQKDYIGLQRDIISLKEDIKDLKNER